MSELKIIEFRERAELALDLPDLAVLEQRGQALRRRRVAIVTGGLLLALVAGFGIASAVSGRPGAAPVPAAPVPTSPGLAITPEPWEAGVRTTWESGEKVLLPGRSEVVLGRAAVSFDAPSDDWEWWEIGVGLRLPTETNDYAFAVFFLPAPTARQRPCGAGLVERLGNDPVRLLANVEPLRGLAGATILQAPRVVEAFGGTAVHVRLRTAEGCTPGALPAQLRGFHLGAPEEPGWGGAITVDAWHVVIPGAEPESLLVLSQDLGSGTDEDRAEKRALLDSLRIEPR